MSGCTMSGLWVLLAALRRVACRRSGRDAVRVSARPGDRQVVACTEGVLRRAPLWHRVHAWRVVLWRARVRTCGPEEGASSGEGC
jgi:hypothetical protein